MNNPKMLKLKDFFYCINERFRRLKNLSIDSYENT